MVTQKKRFLVLIALLVAFALVPFGDSTVYAAKKTNPLKVAGKTATVNYSALQTTAQKLAVSKVVKVKKKGKGKVTYAKKSGNSKITVNKKTGKITVKAGLKRGTYKVKIKVKAAGTKKYKAVTKTVTATIKVAWLKKTIFGTSCMEQNGIWFPASLGAGQYTIPQLKTLGKSKDIDYLQRKINTVSDAVRFFRVNGYKEKDFESIEIALTKRTSSYATLCRAFCFLLDDNMSETGLLRCTGTRQDDLLCYLKKGKYYYAINLYGMLSGKGRIWMDGVKGGCYVSEKLSTITNAFKKNAVDLGTVKAVTPEKYPATIDTPKYTTAQIQALVKQNLTLDEAAAKISTIADALNYLKARGYQCGKFSWNTCITYPEPEKQFNMNYPFNQDNYPDLYNNPQYPIYWGRTLSAEFTYRYNAGTCGGTANLMNRLLKDDFDEEGYVGMEQTSEGHVMNYFKRNGVYYFCDFVNPHFTDDPYRYLLYQTTDPNAFANYYIAANPKFKDKNSNMYLINLYMYPRNGENQLPVGGPENKNLQQQKPNGEWFGNLYSLEVKDTMNILFLRDGYDMDPIDEPPQEAWEYEANHNPVKDDAGNQYDENGNSYEGY